MSTVDSKITRDEARKPVALGQKPHHQIRVDAQSPNGVPEASNSGRSRLGTLTGVQIVATGSFVPDNVVKNEDLAALGYDADWIIQRSGIRERRHAPLGVSTGDMAYEAARNCIEQAGVDIADIDLLVVGTTTPDNLIPSTACQLQDRLGLTAPAMDINAACAGFIYSLVTAGQFVKTGSSRLALVVASDIISRVVSTENKKTYPLFGDAAGAVLVTAGGPSQGMIAYTLGSEGWGSDLLMVHGGGSREPLTVESIAEGRQYLQMDGKPVFKWAVRLLTDTIGDVLAQAQMTMDEVDLVILHQANSRIIDAAVEDLGIPCEKVIVNLDRYGNTSAGSIPLALDEIYRQGRVKPGDTILISGFGAGLSWGTALLKW